MLSKISIIITVVVICISFIFGYQFMMKQIDHMYQKNVVTVSTKTTVISPKAYKACSLWIKNKHIGTDEKDLIKIIDSSFRKHESICILSDVSDKK